MLRLTYPNSLTLEATNEAGQQQQFEELRQQQVYTVAELAIRLSISERSAHDLIRNGEIAYTCCGAKNYRIGEPAVRHFLLGLPPVKQ